LSTLIDKARHYAVVILPNMRHRVFQPCFRAQAARLFVGNMMDESPPPLSAT